MIQFEEQAEVISQIEKRLSIVGEIEIEVDKNLKRVDRLRQSILKKAFSGKLIQNKKSQCQHRKIKNIYYQYT